MARIDYITVGSTTYDIGSTGGHTIQDSNDDTFIGRGYLKFDGVMSVTDNSTDDQTIVDVPAMTSGDVAEVLTPLPSVSTKYPKYSTDEQVVAEWIDGKPVYQKVIETTSTANWGTSATIPDAELIIVYYAAIKIQDGTNDWLCLNYDTGGTGTNRMIFGVKDNKIQTYCPNYPNKPMIFIVQYTKTTDTPTS